MQMPGTKVPNPFSKRVEDKVLHPTFGFFGSYVSLNAYNNYAVYLEKDLVKFYKEELCEAHDMIFEKDLGIEQLKDLNNTNAVRESKLKQYSEELEKQI